MQKKIITHIIARDKFTKAYIWFFLHEFDEYEHHFVTLKTGFDIQLDFDADMVYVADYHDIFRSKPVAALLKKSCKIVISPASCVPLRYRLHPRLLRKTYLHFWGADFYPYREKPASVLGKMLRNIKYGIFKKAAGLCFLIDGEYEEFARITNVKNAHFIASMPFKVYDIDYKKYRHEFPMDKQQRNIIIGNSAAPSNEHIEMLNMLKEKTTGNECDIYCPLSYGGSPEYVESVIAEGKKLFGDRFHALTEFMEKETYVAYLSQMDIAIYNNNRQQGMGNIAVMFALGKKVYIRDDVTMWREYQRRGHIVHSVQELQSGTCQDFFAIDQSETKHNELLYDERVSHPETKRLWSVVLNG